ncbi:MAG: phosphatase PAP2 family protein [Clostridiales bacterium]|nr:phosphatase PAP2 family protein [Clostridiales bacterium]
MNIKLYKKTIRFFQLHPTIFSIVALLNQYITLIGFLIYPLLLLIVALQFGKSFFAYLFIPAFCYIAMSRFRQIINRKRPYEYYGYQPLIPRNGGGESFPSRHVFSIFLIGTLWYVVFWPVAVFVLLLGVILAVIRVITGIHFPSDVICGAALGILCGVLTLFVSSL